MKIKSQTLDLIAFTSSIFCALHCAAIPIILSFTSLSSLHFLDNHNIEWFFIGLGLILVVTTLWPSYRKAHGKIWPLLFSVLGFTIIGIGKIDFTASSEIVYTVIGAIFVSIAHFKNWRLIRKLNMHNHL